MSGFKIVFDDGTEGTGELELTRDGGHCWSVCPQCDMTIWIPNRSGGKFFYPCRGGTEGRKDCPYKGRP